MDKTLQDSAVPKFKAGQAATILRGLGGAILGGIAGYVLFRLLLAYGLYGLMIPGVVLGLGAGWSAGGRSRVLGILCGVLALALMIVAEWHRAPMIKDESLLYFVTHLHQLNGATLKLLMLALGTAAAYWFGQGR